MPLNKGKHIIGEIDGVRCTIVETDITENRMNFLKKLLDHNNFTVKVKVEKKESAGTQSGNENLPVTYTIGVTDIVFNPVIAVYQKRLRTFDGKIVTPAYWNQAPTQTDHPYWMVKPSPVGNRKK